MARQKVARKKRYFSVDQANQMLPLVRAITKDVTELAQDLMQRQERLSRLTPRKGLLDPVAMEGLHLSASFVFDCPHPHALPTLMSP